MYDVHKKKKFMNKRWTIKTMYICSLLCFVSVCALLFYGFYFRLFLNGRVQVFNTGTPYKYYAMVIG